MNVFIKPYKPKRLRNKLAKEMTLALSNAPVAPIQKLNEEAREFEKLMLSRRSGLAKNESI